MKIKDFPKHSFSLLPTPFYKLENISKEFSINLYCKRDDLTGFAFGGNKTRKLDYLIADAKNKKSDALIASGAVQSNFCRIAAAAGKVAGFDVHLVLGGNKSEAITGNLLLDHLFGSTIHFVDSSEWNDWETQANRLMYDLEHRGRKVYYLPVGGSTPVGALGYVNAFNEILNDCKRMNVTIDTIIHASSSGGTQAGLIVGKSIAKWNGKIIGIGAAKNQTILSEEIYNLASITGKMLGVNINSEDVNVDASYIGGGYGVKTQESEDAIKLFAEREGIVLDYVYTGKAVAGLLDYTKRGLFSAHENVLFIHTGGNVEMFA
jgi:D-cysteine desulfhydrase family pyridoxal phosphate-dependent enzyme